MNENLYNMFDDILVSDFNIIDEGIKKVVELGKNAEYGKMETYSIFPGIILSYIDMHVENMENVFFEDNISSRMLEINHCASGRYAYQVGDDRIIYFEKGDLCISISDVTKSVSDFPLGYYKGLEIFMDIDVANEYIKRYLPDFDIVEFYEGLMKNNGYVLVRANERIDHVIGELYDVDERIKLDYFRLKCIELLLFFSITEFRDNDKISLSRKQADIVENVKNDLINDLESQITIDELASKYAISKTSLKNCFREVYGKPIFRWRKEYRLDYACKLIEQDELTISEISKRVGYSSPSKFSQAFKDYIGCTPSEFRK
ncbi:MAG: helix-turn-helix transcriptional regulator [Methanobrevibacter sp.]|uniref:helix-turn-helix domain-containing protein n=1 Tax=Methanobrevibacter sp. TaxID=66852 RepID=UPI0025D6E013|nr:AraC family transcriptional regulator [Methanobrevibacter sp.]MBE6497652.1 helix-turn-helix transcriptional regulator [Methanobrevibacter sp.]